MKTSSIKSRKLPSNKAKSKAELKAGFDPDTIVEVPSMDDALEKFKRITGICKECNAIPDIGIEEFRGLCVSIATTGLQHSILITDDGELVDGRCRLRACYVTGVAPRWRTIQNGQSRFAIAMANFARRSLTPGQKAAFACQLLPPLKAWAKDRQRKNARTPKASDAEKPATDEFDGLVDYQTIERLRLCSGSARDQAAALVGCSGKLVSDFLRLQEIRPEWAKEVEAGGVALGSKMALLNAGTETCDSSPIGLTADLTSTGNEDDEFEATVAAEVASDKPGGSKAKGSVTTAVSPKATTPSPTKPGKKPQESREAFFAELLATTQKYSHANLVILEPEWLTVPLILLRSSEGWSLTVATPDDSFEEHLDGELEKVVVKVLENQLRKPNKNLLVQGNNGIRADLLSRFNALPAKRGVTAPAPKKTKGRAVKKASKPKRKAR